MNMKKTVLNTAIAASLGFAAAVPVQAAVVTADWTGYFTMLKANGEVFTNVSSASNTTFYGYRTPITGTFSFNTSTGAGTATVASFSFGAAGVLATASSITMQAIGDGNCTTSGCGPGTLVLGNMGFTWPPNTAIAVSIVLDAAGFFTAIGGPSASLATVSQTIDNVGVYAASENSKFPVLRTGALYPMGLSPFATTEWNTSFTGNTTGCSWPNCNPSGMLPLVLDTATDAAEDTNTANGTHVLGTATGNKGVGGSPMLSGPFPTYNANFDVDTIHITSVTPDVAPIPVPAAVWLFGSGLLGLVGIARRKKKA